MRWFRNLLLGLIFVIAVAIIVGGYLFYDVTRGPLPQHSGTISVDGLNASVEIVRDDVGIPHIYASNTYDLFFAQGYTQAQDRWWQMEFSRHTGNGSLSKLIGENDEIRGVDVFIRTAGWRQAAEADLPELSDNARAVLEAFSDGVNAYITDKNPSDLAIEYSILGLTGVNFDIEPWTPIDSLVWGKVMAWDLGANRSRELTISRMLEDENISDEMVADFFPSFPFGEMPTILESDEIPLVADGASQAAQDTQPSRYTVGDVRFAGGVAHDVNIAFGYGLSLGSNNWVVSGDLTESGMPLMANDMHLSVGIPAIWYEVGLHCQPVGDDCPYDVRGFTFPAVPAVVAGHNSNIGWAFTNVGVDTQDLYMIRVNPETRYSTSGMASGVI
jgi:penicillin amidase